MIIDCENSLGRVGDFKSTCTKGIQGGKPCFGHCVIKCGLCTNTVEQLNEYMIFLAEGPVNKEPSIRTKATSLLKHAGQVAKGLTQGKALASKKEQARRLTICKSNKCNNYNTKGTCNKCGCGLNNKVKAEALWCQYWEKKND